MKLLGSIVHSDSNIFLGAYLPALLPSVNIWANLCRQADIHQWYTRIIDVNTHMHNKPGCEPERLAERGRAALLPLSLNEPAHAQKPLHIHLSLQQSRRQCGIPGSAELQHTGQLFVAPLHTQARIQNHNRQQPGKQQRRHHQYHQQSKHQHEQLRSFVAEPHGKMV